MIEHLEESTNVVKATKNDMGNYCKYHCRSIADNIKYVYTR